MLKVAAVDLSFSWYQWLTIFHLYYSNSNIINCIKHICNPLLLSEKQKRGKYYQKAVTPPTSVSLSPNKWETVGPLEGQERDLGWETLGYMQIFIWHSNYFKRDTRHSFSKITVNIWTMLHFLVLFVSAFKSLNNDSPLTSLAFKWTSDTWFIFEMYLIIARINYSR